MKLSAAFDREHRVKRARIEATDGLAAEAQSGYRYMQRGIGSTSRTIESATSRVLIETSGMSAAVENLNAAATSSLGTIRNTTQGLAAEATREDKPTGLTPRKRGRRVVEDLPRTEPREVLVRRWRQRGMSAVGSETFLAEHLPLPEDGDSPSGSPEFMAVDSPIEALAEDLENEPTPLNSPPALVKSLASSASSSSSVPPELPPVVAVKVPTKVVANATGTLTDRSTNIARRPQRTRRTVPR